MVISITVKTGRKEELIDITRRIQQEIDKLDVNDGICYIFIPHTTAGITINENADPSVQSDILMGIKNLKIEDNPFRHSEGNSPAHIKSSLFGCSLSVIIENGRLLLGTWQGIYFCEFDGPRTRKAYLKIIRE